MSAGRLCTHGLPGLLGPALDMKNLCASFLNAGGFRAHNSQFRGSAGLIT